MFPSGSDEKCGLSSGFAPTRRFMREMLQVPARPTLAAFRSIISKFRGFIVRRDSAWHTLVCFFLILSLALSLTAGAAAGCSRAGRRPPPIAGAPVPEPGPEPQAGAPPQTETPPVPEAKLVKSWEVDGSIWYGDPRGLISPDEKHLIVHLTGDDGIRLVAFSLDGSEPRGVALHAADKKWIQNYAFGYRPLGWITDKQFIFAAFGWQNSGPHKGKRGVALLVGDVEKGSSEEVAFVGLPEGLLWRATFLREKNKAYFHVSGAIWEYDATRRALKRIKGDLPTYDRLFFPKLSPTGDHFVYELHEPGENGIFILDTATSEERPLLPNGETMSFYPSWSRDGKLVAAYTVNRKKDAPSGTSWQAYDLLEGEDGPQPVGSMITIADLEGRILKKIEVDGKWVSAFVWGSRGGAVGFVAGTVREASPSFPMASFVPDSVWVAEVRGDAPPVKLADIQREGAGKPPFVVPVALSPDERGLFYNVYGEENWKAFHASRAPSPGSAAPAPVPVASNGGLAQQETPVIYGDYMVGVITGRRGETSEFSVWFLGSSEKRKVAEFTGSRFTHTAVIGYSERLLAIANGELVRIDRKPRPTTIQLYEVIY